MRGSRAGSPGPDAGLRDGALPPAGQQQRAGSWATRVAAFALRPARSLLIANALSIAAAVIAGAALTLLVTYFALMQPRIERVVALTGALIETVRTLAASAEPQQHELLLRTLRRGSDESIVAVQLEDARFVEPSGWVEREFLGRLRDRLPGLGLGYSVGPAAGIWFEVPVPGREPIWLSLKLRVIPLAIYLVPALALASLLAAVALTLWLQARMVRPMRALGDAVRTLGDGDSTAPLPMPRSTEFVELTARFNTLAARLRELESERSLLLASISHDLRTPLTKLRLGLALRDGDLRVEAQVARHLDDIDRIVSRFVDFARADRESETLIPLDLNDLVREVAAGFELDGSPFDLALQPLPSLRLQPISMQRALSNLMANAVRYGRDSLQVRTTLHGDRVSLQVLDRGPGVEPHELAALGRPFVRTVAARGIGSGTGLGLAIARRVAEAHGGRLVIGTRAGGGFAATIELPTTAMHPPEDETPENRG
jgi:two-component system, OmpR family, osmolarity sensor histidine kinase EnvZ